MDFVKKENNLGGVRPMPKKHIIGSHSDNKSFKKLFGKMGFGGPPNPANRKRKKIVIGGATILVVLVIVFIVGGDLTGFSVANIGGAQEEINGLRVLLNSSNDRVEEVEGELTAKQEELLVKIEELNQVESELTAKENELDEAESKIATYEDGGVENSEKVDQLEEEKENLEEEKEEIYDALKNSVRTICCSFDDIKSNRAQSWDIDNDIIICEGGFEISCGSGNTDFDED